MFLILPYYRLTGQYQKAMSEVNETYQFYVSMLEERRAEISRELEQVSRVVIKICVSGSKIDRVRPCSLNSRKRPPSSCSS